MKIGYGVDGGHDLIISGERFAGYEHKYMAARDQQLFMKFLVARAIDEGSISPGATIIK